MTENLEHKQVGRIIFWNTIYGFIQQSDNSSIFFHKSDILIDNIEDLSLLNEVSYSISKVEKGRHKGKLIATEIVKENDAVLSEYKRYIGRLTKWSKSKGKYFGYIESPQQNKTVLFYETRNFYKGSTYKNGDLVVFHQVKSTKDKNQLFALFAYPIFKETSISFLQQQYSDSHIEEIKDYINQLISARTDLSIEEKFYQELINIEFVDNPDSYLTLKSIIKAAKEKNYKPKIDLLKEYCAPKYLIQLWEEEIIDNYDIEILKQYFHNTNADNKRYLISKFQSNDKKEILNYHFDSLKIEGKIQHLNNNVKTLLDIVYRNENDREIEIYETIKGYLFQEFYPEELINLWLGGYIDSLTERFILENLDIDNHQIIQTLLNKQEKKYSEVLKKIYENYFLKLTKSNFDDELPQLVKRLKIFEKEYENRYKEITTVIRNILDDDKLFVLWVFGVSIDFDAQDYFDKNHKKINDYYKIRFILHYATDSNEELILSLIEIADITQESILDFVSNYPWNNLLNPTVITPENDSVYFLQDIETYISKFNITNISTYDIGLLIFNSLPKYQVHHIRLWLYGYVDEELYDYIGFREIFKELTSDEQSIFKKKGEFSSYNANVIEPEVQEVEPCIKIISETIATKIYLALIPNLYFGDGYIRLRIEDKSYTKKRKEPYASSGLNRIPKSSDFSKLPVEIEVLKKENEIINVKGLNEIFTLIHTGEIEKALGIVVEPDKYRKKNLNKSYVEDWQLRKQILDFLNKSQTDLLEPKTVYEPKNLFRRLDVDSGIDTEELTRLYTIDTTDGFGIVWENIDLTEDRATYIFKTEKQFHRLQLEKIAHSIVSFAQFRSTLISSKKQKQLQIFKDNLGFVASIRKQRGKNKSFENWLGKLESYLLRSIPIIPSDEEIESLKDWSPEIPHTTRINRPKPARQPKIPKPINDRDTPTLDIDFTNDDGTNRNKQKEEQKEKRKQLFTALKTFNNSFLENFKFNTDGQ